MVGHLFCTFARDDLAGSNYPVDCGFRLELPDYVFDGKSHTLEIRTMLRRDEPLIFIHEGRQKTSLRFQGIVRPIIHGMVDDIAGDAILGWVLRETPDGKQGRQSVLVTSDDEPVMEVKADRFRPDVASEHQADAYCGFRFVVPFSVRRPRRQAFRFYLLPEKTELDGSPFIVNLMADAQQSKIVQLSGIIARLEHDLRATRTLLDSLLPTEQFTLDNYQDWAERYFPSLRQRQWRLTSTPLISVICPTYRPNMAHFTAMVGSVRAQTYDKWQLIIVDDGTNEPALTAMLNDICTCDQRIIALTQPTNGGISSATAFGLSHAKGTWVAFLDHDDLLDPQALLVMLSEAQRTGATLLYSDEDKINSLGELVEPHFKPNWNYRLVLANNYLCHLLMVERQAIERITFSPTFDGAQDHHLVLALSERLDPARIHHVPEILYHWRTARDSTASSSGAKPYAAKAGVAAIRAHLKRRKKAASRVTPIDGTTFYCITWKTRQSPRVAVIVPFKDQAEITQRCIESLERTNYPNYEIILVDNWSTDEAALSFLRAAEQRDDLSVVRVEEPFNFARLNNLAAAKSNAEYFVFHNNDVIQRQQNWLRLLMDEMLADPAVAAVGPKLVYPSGFVQHAGVILGLGGVADHAHRGLPATAPGYAGRALVAQEVTAVTAACMLVRAPAFREVGGFEEKLAVAFNDIDLCLKLRQNGQKIVFCPDVVAVHHESVSRGRDDSPLKRERLSREVRLMWERWGEQLRADPFYSRHFGREGEAFYMLNVPLPAIQTRQAGRRVHQ
jgi:GT2 family glycosyltransferase